MKYCTYCGSLLKRKNIKGKERLICSGCARIHYQHPIPTVDTIIKMGEGIILIKRRNPPYGWALPGGFVDYGESLEEAAKREVKEETNLNLKNLRQLHTYSHPKRDPRFHTITTVFVGEGEGKSAPADDAEEVRVFKEKQIPSLDLAFDHGQILHDYFHMGRIHV